MRVHVQLRGRILDVNFYFLFFQSERDFQSLYLTRFHRDVSCREGPKTFSDYFYGVRTGHKADSFVEAIGVGGKIR